MGVFLKRYDLETFISELDAYMKINLPLQITAMNADRASLTLASIDDAAYYFQTIQEGDIPYSPFVFYGETGTKTRGQGPEQAKEYTLQVSIILANSNEAIGTMGTRLLRYRECLEEVFQKGWNDINKRVKLEISGISPFPFSVNQDSSLSHVGIGVNLDFEIV